MNRKKKSGRIIALLILLALLCIGTVELAVCSVADPALFQKLTRPVITAVQRALSMGQALLPALPSEPDDSDDPPANQLASTPAVTETYEAEPAKVTDFSTRNGVEVLTGGNVELIYYNQGEAPWATQFYGPDEIKGYGCGPTAMAMVVSTLSSQIVDPAAMASWAYQQGYCAPGSGSYYSLIQGAADAYGLEASAWTELTADSLTEALASGRIFVALMTKGHFTSNGHFIILRGITLEGKVLVADPNSRERSLTTWDPQLIIDELSPARSSGAPLWAFSVLPNLSTGG